MDFDYFYNREAERFNFLKVPEILVYGEVMDIFGSKKIFKRLCECDRNRLKKKLREKNSKKLKI